MYGVGLLAEVHDAGDDDGTTLHRGENAAGKSVNQQTPVSLVEDRGDLRELAELPESHVQVAHENLAPPRLKRLVKLESGLNVGIGGEKENKLTHC